MYKLMYLYRYKYAYKLYYDTLLIHNLLWPIKKSNM